VLISGLAMASLPTIVFFHPRAVPESEWEKGCPALVRGSPV
jgi:hypothetical protein